MTSHTDLTYQIDLQVLDSDDLQVVEEIKALIQDSLATNKEAWLLHSLLDYYARTQSEHCMEVLVTLADHHVKHLYDKLQEHMKGNHRLSTFNLLAYLVRKQSPWLHKLVSHPLFTSILKCLKADADIPVLLGGVLFVTALLPLVPLAIGNHLNDIFDIFTRLASFNIRKPVGNIPDIYLLHLHVGVDCLFHRLYGMYPCHFITYLRAFFAKKENVQVFDDVIKPMCERVKMHPLLITMSRDKELTTDRWMKIEVHDIVEDCSRLSLDLTQYHHEIERMHLGPPTHSQLNKMIADTATPVLTDSGTHHTSMKPQLIPADLTDSILKSVSQTAVSDSFWSPSVLCGLATPPASESVTPAGSLIDVHATASSSFPTTVSNTSGMFATPVNTPLESPLPQDEGRVHIISQAKTSMKKTSGSNITRGFSFLDSPQNVPVQTTLLQSPLKSGFTTEPPEHSYKTKAMRKLPLMENVDFDDSDSVLEETLQAKISENDVAPSRTATSSNTHSSSQDARFETEQVEGISKSEDNKGENTEEDGVKTTAGSVNEETGSENTDMMTSSTQSVVSVHSLHEVIDSLDHLATEDFVDEEVSELTQEQYDSSSSNSESYDEFPSHLRGMADSEVTAESVAQFMKNVNRIRFNSMNIDRTAMQDKVEKSWKTMRSKSCPQLKPESDDIDADDVDGDDDDDDSEKYTNDERKMFSLSLDTANKESINQDIPSTLSETITTVHSMVTTKVVYSRSTSMTYGQHSPDRVKAVNPLMPHEELFPYALPNAAYLGSYSIVDSKSAQVTDSSHEKGSGSSSVPVTFSPAQILDRFLQLGEEVHSKELSQIPLSSHQSISWTHFGGRPPVDEVNILRGQILLLHSQLMFERHKRELHAKRNRRLLGKLVKATALEEQNAAMRDQLRLQENEINNFSVALRLEQEKSRQLKEEADNARQTHKYQMQSYAEQMEVLQIAKKKLQSDLSSSHQQNDELIKELQLMKAQLFNKEQDLNDMHRKASFAEDMKAQLEKTKKEVLMMGELIQRYQQKVTALKYSHRPRPEMQLMLDSAKTELTAIRSQLEQKCFQVEILTARNAEVEDQLKGKDEFCSNLKRELQEMKNVNAQKIEMLTDKYNTQKKIQVTLQEKLLDLNSQVKRLSKSGGSLTSLDGASSSKSSVCTSSSYENLWRSSKGKLSYGSDQCTTPRGTPSPDVTQAATSSRSRSAFSSYRPQQSGSSSALSLPAGSTTLTHQLYLGSADEAHRLQADELAQEAEFMSDSEPSLSSQISSRMSDKET